MDTSTLLLGLLLSFAAAIVPTAGWMAIIWWCDRYEREPIPLVTAAFVWGAAPAIILALIAEGILGAPLFGAEGALAGELVTGSVLVPVIEELAKGAALILILLFWPREIDDILDGILYGALIGFGFAMTENFFYFIGALVEDGWSGWGVVVFLRSIVFGLNHAFFTALTGAGLGYAQMARRGARRVVMPLMGLGAAILAHALHNLGAGLATMSAGSIVISLVSDAAGVLFVAVLIGLAVRQERQWLRTELAGEVGGLLTADEYEALLSLRGRVQTLNAARRAGGINGMRAAGLYQQRVTELAFRKRRARVQGMDDNLRAQIAELSTAVAGRSRF